MSRKIAFFLCLVVISCMSLAARADTIGPNCSSCFGSTYTLSYAPTGTANQYDITYTINTTGYTGTSTNVLNAAAVKIVANYSSITQLMLLSAPSGFTLVPDSGLNANGCAGGGGGFFCVADGTSGVPVAHAGDIYTFTFLVTVNNASSLLTGSGAASIKALYNTASGQQNGITSESITLQPGSPVPEPSSFLLTGTGLIALAFASKKLFA